MPHTSRTSLYVAVAAASLVLASLQPPDQGVSDGGQTVRQWVDQVSATLSTPTTLRPGVAR